MNASRKLAAYAIGLAVVFGGATVVGNAMGPTGLANAEPAGSQPPAPTVAAPVILAPTIDAIELDAGQSFVSGSGPADALMRLYVSDPEVIALGGPLLALGAAFQLFDALQLVVGGALRGAGDTRWPFLVQTALAWALRLPLAWLFAVTLGGGVVGAWYAEFVFVLSLAAALALRFRSGAWRELRI